MQLDPEKVAECQSWLARAWADIDATQILLAAEPPRTDVAVFHCQQAVEKSLKAFLFWNDVPFRRTHELEELGKACVALDASLAQLTDRAADLSEFAWLFRYPGEEEEPAQEEAEEVLALAQEVYEAVLARLPTEVRR